MYHVTTVCLSPDVTRFDPAIEPTALGELSGPDVVVLLERLRTLPVEETAEVEPHLIIVGRAGKFHVRAGNQRLFLYNARDTIEPYAELSAIEILTQLDRTEVTAPPFAFSGGTAVPATVAAADAAARPAAAPHRGIAAAILVAGLLLNGYTLYSVVYVDSVNHKPDVTLITNPGEAAAREKEILGTFATGNQKGDRVITIMPGRRVKFSEVGKTGALSESADVFEVARRGSRLCLNTRDSGAIDVLNLETVVYYRDTYRRTR
jgi:hypothetical protein